MGERSPVEGYSMSQRPHLLASFIQEARGELRGKDPAVLAANSGAKQVRLSKEEGELRLSLWGEEYVITYPEIEACQGKERCSDWQWSLFLHYLRTADGTPLADRWVSLREIPGGRFYHEAFQGYSGNRLAGHFGNDLEAFRRAAEGAGGERRDLGDAGYAFQALPRLSLAVVYWSGDEDFSPTASVLFDASAGHYLPVDGLAVLGRQLCDRIMRASR